MTHGRTWASILRVGGYFLVAVVIAVALVVMASRGAFFQAGHGSYTVVVPRAPGVHANKTDVLNPAGVPIGVVVGMTDGPAGVELTLKLTRTIPVHADASAVVGTKTILGEKSVFLDPGEADEVLADGARLAAPVDIPPVEPHEALDPIVGIGEDLPEVEPLIDELESTLVPVVEDLEVIAADVQGLTSTVSQNQQPLLDIAGRARGLLDDLATHSTDISTLAGDVAALTRDLAQIVDRDLQQVSGIIVAVSRLSAAVTGRLTEVNQAFAALPEVAVKLEGILDQLVRVFEGEAGQVVLADAVNLPTLDHWLDILEEGRS